MSKVIFSCGVGDKVPFELLDLVRKDEYGCNSFKRKAPVHVYERGDGKQVLVPISGPAIFGSRADEFWGGEDAEDYQSGVIENPTYADLMRVAAASIRRTRDRHHCFLEGAIRTKDTVNVDGREVPVYDLIFGS